MNPRAVLLPLAVLAAGAGIALATRPSGPAGPAPSAGNPPAPAGGGSGSVPSGPWHPQNLRHQLVPRTERIPCRVRAPEPVTILPPVDATPVETVLVREGQAVRKGDLLLTFGAAPWKRALADAERGGDAARAAEARRALSSLEVRAPEDGIVHSLDARRGERPVPTRGVPRPLVVLFDWRRLSYEATAPASMAEILARNPRVFVGSGKHPPVDAEIVVNGPAAPDGSFPLVLRPREAPPFVPEPGGEGDVLVMTGTREAPVVPATAVRTEGGRSVVYVVTVTGGLVRRTVIPGMLAHDGFVEVSGLKPGESVAVWE